MAFVTTVAMSATRRLHPPSGRLAAFHLFEGPFSGQSRVSVLLAGLSGFWMCWRADLWSRFLDPHSWWIAAMLLLLLAFVSMLFVIEPPFMHQRMRQATTPAANFTRMEWLHRVALAIAIVTIAASMARSHGLI